MVGTLTATLSGGVAQIVIDNADRRNCLTFDMWMRIPELLQTLADDDAVLSVVLRGRGETFSAGADIADLPRILLEPDAGPGGVVTVAEEALARFPKPTIAAVDGACFGGGWELAAACDFRVATTRSTFGVTPAKLGIVYPLSGIRRLTRLVGPATSKYLLMTAETVSADRALQLGMLTTVVAPEDLDAEVGRLLDRMASLSQLSVRAAKQLIDLGDAATLAEASWSDETIAAEEWVEGSTAFRDKRPPAFSWRAPQTR